jgi:hypothetical protein
MVAQTEVDRKEYKADWYQRNKNRLAVYKADWYQRNKNRITAKTRENPSEKTKTYKAKWYQRNKKRLDAQSTERYQENRIHILTEAKNKYLAEREKKIAFAKAHYAALSVEKKQVKIARASLRDKLNPEQARARTSLRRKRNQQSTPVWLSKKQKKEIKDFYLRAIELTKSTGVQHHVDHILPLAGKTLCGLHVPWNLQILTASENSKKSNKVI